MGLLIYTQPQAFTSSVTIGSNTYSVSGLTVNGPISASDYIISPSINSNAFFLNGENIENRYVHISGGVINGSLRINENLIVNYLSALSGATFVNTTFTTTSALCVQSSINDAPAFYVGANGSGDIASFYDTDQNVEVLHVGGANGSFPNVGIKNSSPNKDFTVKGELSASNSIWTDGSFLSAGTNLNDIFGSKTRIDSVFNTVSSNSASWESGGGSSIVSSSSSNWNTAYSFVTGNSANATFSISVSTQNISANTLTINGYPITSLTRVYTVGNGTDLTYTLSLSDNNNTVTMSASNSGIIYVNSAINYPNGYQVNIIQLNTGRITLSGIGITLYNDFNYFKTYSKYSACTILNIGEGIWVVYGALSSN